MLLVFQLLLAIGRSAVDCTDLWMDNTKLFQHEMIRLTAVFINGISDGTPYGLCASKSSGGGSNVRGEVHNIPNSNWKNCWMGWRFPIGPEDASTRLITQDGFIPGHTPLLEFHIHYFVDEDRFHLNVYYNNVHGKNYDQDIPQNIKQKYYDLIGKNIVKPRVLNKKLTWLPLKLGGLVNETSKIFEAEQNTINELADYYDDNEYYEDDNDDELLLDDYDNDYFDGGDYDESLQEEEEELSMQDILDDIMFYYNQLSDTDDDNDLSALDYDDLYEEEGDDDNPPGLIKRFENRINEMASRPLIPQRPVNHPIMARLKSFDGHRIQQFRKRLHDQYIPRLKQVGTRINQWRQKVKQRWRRRKRERKQRQRQRQRRRKRRRERRKEMA